MKKFLFSAFAFATGLLFTSCGNGSSGSTMLDLDVRIVPHPFVKERLEKAIPEERQKDEQKIEDFSNLFTVLPGPYEFTWEELKNEDGATGYEMCATKLKVKLRLNKTLKPLIHSGWHDGQPYTDEEMVEAILGFYEFAMFNAEGKTDRDLSAENADGDYYRLFLKPSLRFKRGVNGKIGSTDNKDDILDFYHFLTDKPGTEFDLMLDCGHMLCKDIKDIIAYNKGLFIMPTAHVTDGMYKFQYE